jgi:RNA polymerase sigma-54 factor
MELRGELRQVLAPEMLQLLKLLQMPTLELQQLVRQELEINPMLEEVPEGEDIKEGAEELVEEPDQDQGTDDKIDWQDYLQEEMESAPQSCETTPEVTGFPIISCRESLHDNLVTQLRIASGNGDDVGLGELIIGNLDGDGFLKVPLEEIAKQAGCQTEQVAQALKKVQSLDPPGVGARDLRECLLIQLARQGKEGTLAWRVVTSHFDLLERQRLPAIARALKTTVAEVARAQKVIAGLSPRPGSGLDTEEPRYVYPDVIIEKVGDGYQIIPNDRAVPRVRLTPGYKQILRQAKSSSPEDRAYVAKRIEAARFIIRMIEQRRRTIGKILEAVVSRQRDFLENGIRAIQPMTMGQVAQDIGMHESTVSRAVQNKYALTPHGVVPLRSLFGGGLKTDAGIDSSRGIKAMISDLVGSEDAKKPLTDGQIAKMLKQRGINIARRTVAKYREEERILPTRLRRKR